MKLEWEKYRELTSIWIKIAKTKNNLNKFNFCEFWNVCEAIPFEYYEKRKAHNKAQFHVFIHSAKFLESSFEAFLYSQLIFKYLCFLILYDFQKLLFQIMVWVNFHSKTSKIRNCNLVLKKSSEVTFAKNYYLHKLFQLNKFRIR